MSTLQAFSITRVDSNKTIHLVKKCYIMKHAHLKQDVWNTKILIRLAYLDDMLDEIVDMYRKQLGVPYIPNIKKGDVVTIQQKRILNAEEVVDHYLLQKEKIEYEL